MAALENKPRVTEGKDVIYRARGARWASWAMELLDAAYRAECKMRWTADNHVKIVNDLGDTATIAGRNGTNGARSRKDANKVIDAQVQHQLHKATNDPKTPEYEPSRFCSDCGGSHRASEPHLETVPPVTAESFDCPIEACPLTYKSQDELAEHTKTDHWVCPQCGDVLPSGRSAGGHVGIKHGENQPWTAKRNFKGKAGTVEELIDDVRRGKVFREPVRTNPNGTRKTGRVQDVDLPETPPVAPAVDPRDQAVELLLQIRKALGDDPRIAAMTAERDHWKRRAEDAEAKIEMMQNAARQLNEAAGL